jgi:hypothetical protein
MQDAFEQNAVAALLGAQYDYVICGTRFDPSSAVWNTAEPAMPTVDAAAPAEPMDVLDVCFFALVTLAAEPCGQKHCFSRPLWSAALTYNALVLTPKPDEETT